MERVRSRLSAESGRRWSMETRDCMPPAKTTKIFVLCLACTFSIGSHYSQNCIGPLKDILKADLSLSDTEMALLFSSNIIPNTVLPIVAGLLVARYGPVVSSLFATGSLFLGQLINLFSLYNRNVSGMTFGLCLFGAGISPLALIQETLVVQVFDGSGLGLAVALGLVLGKASSFVAALTTTSLALHTSQGYHTPFIISTSLTLLSVILNYIFVHFFNEDSNSEQLRLNKHKPISKSDMYEMPKIFWIYLLLCFFAGSVWTPFVQLATSFVALKFSKGIENATMLASIVLSMPIILYPLVGWISDRYGHRLFISM